ncbi:MAG: 4,5-dihydroxyphthalate decarboxylase [Candidatus Protistobacter heckmanni]|nr:4,5-dihydroxyphthalate decarboxylase [Candidatus Protistobacter heckmanni]
MGNLRLTLAIGDYDHTRDLALGRVRPDGIDLTVLNNNVEEIFFRFFDALEWEVSEISMGMYVSRLSRGDTSMIAIPVFPSRGFRHSAIYVRADGPIAKPQDLRGKRIGLPQWSQTATIYVKGYIAETLGIPLGGIQWVQGGVNQAGRDEWATLRLPEGICLSVERERSLNDMLLTGEIDALISARAPAAFVQGDPQVRRLFPDSRAEEEAYFATTSIFPIMHTVAIRRDAYEANRWIARNLTLALNEAKNRSVARLFDVTASAVPVPWAVDHVRQASGGLVFKDGEPWPYGVESHRRTLDAFLRFAFEQGVCHRRMEAEELFAPEALAEIKV